MTRSGTSDSASRDWTGAPAWRASISRASSMRALSILLVALVVRPALAVPAGGGGKVFLTVEEALHLAYPDCTVERRTVYLTEEQRKRAAELAGLDLDGAVVRPYVAMRGKELAGTAWFDAHRVRTKNAVLMFAVGPDRKVARVELLAFAEPVEYVPRASFYAQFVGRKLDAELDLERGIQGVTGATLTARTATEAARRVLALHEVVFPPGP
jgi:hypothetical protein